MTPLLSVVVPCRDEAAQIDGTLAALVRAARAAPGPVEILAVANGCADDTEARVASFAPAVTLVQSRAESAPAARNDGARRARGRVLAFVDADTRVPPEGLARVLDHVDRGRRAGIFALAPQTPTLRARAFFALWNHARRLPLAHAKAMPAFMFATREAFWTHGPFDETVKIGEEWPILAGLYRAHPEALVYDRACVARTSSRRMDLRPLGYLRVLGRYTWAVLHASGRLDYPADVREEAPCDPTP